MALYSVSKKLIRFFYHTSVLVTIIPAAAFAVDMPTVTKQQGVYLGLQGGYGFRSDGEDRAAASVYTGYQFNKNFALEAGYMRMMPTESNSKVSGSGVSIGYTNDGTKHEVEYILGQNYAFDLDLKATLPLTKRVGLYAKGGGAYVNTVVDNGSSTNPIADPHNAFTGDLGMGTTVYLYKNLMADMSWTHYFKHNQVPNIDYVALGLTVIV